MMNSMTKSARARALASAVRSVALAAKRTLAKADVTADRARAARAALVYVDTQI